MGLFSRKPKLDSTGDDADDQLLALISKKSDLDAPRDWIHYLHFPDEVSAQSAARSISDSGWVLQPVEKAAGDEDEWVVMAERHDAVLSPTVVRETRQYFESVTAGIPGAYYDGWEASL